MKTRAVKFVVAIAAAILSSANCLAAPESAEQATDKCLTAPGEKTPAGGHWRYRLERGTGRQCWYLKNDVEKSARKAPEETAAAAVEPAAAPARRKPPATPSLSDARAEFSRTAVEPESKPAQAQPSPFPAPTTAANQPASAKETNVVAPMAATRWPDPTSFANRGASAPAPASEPSEDVRPAQTAAAPAPPQIMPRAVPPAPASEKPLSLPMMITIVAGGLSVVGVILSMLFGWRASRPRLTPTAPMPPLEEPADPPRRPGDLYRERKTMRTPPGRRRAA